MKTILFVGHELNVNETLFLEKIMISFGQPDFTKVDLIHSCDWDDLGQTKALFSQAPLKVVLCFGISYLIPNLAKYQPVAFEQAILCEVDPVWVLINEPSLKKKLWGCLQAIQKRVAISEA